MKKALVLTLAMVMGLGLATMAGPLGPFVGLQLVPTVPSVAKLVGGWSFGDVTVECSKADFAVWSGDWTIAALWTPDHQTHSYRVGLRLMWDWKANGALEYQGVAFILGVAKTWGPFQLFGELDFETKGVLKVKPLVGVNILLLEFLPPPTG